MQVILLAIVLNCILPKSDCNQEKKIISLTGDGASAKFVYTFKLCYVLYVSHIF